MYSFGFFLDFEKEERWLNKMGKRGYLLVDKQVGIYHFRKSENIMNIKIDYRNFSKKSDYEDYLTLFEDGGWKRIVGSMKSGVQYFQRVNHEATDDIFSDEISKASRYQRLYRKHLTLLSSFLPFLVVLFMSGAINVESMLNPKSLYYTPGLWEATGFSFWRAFLFETPFALARGYLGPFLALLALLYILLSIKGLMKYHKRIKP